MPVFTAPGGASFEMRTGEPGASIAALFRIEPASFSGDATSAVRYSEFTGVEVEGTFTGADIYGWPLQGTITTLRFYILPPGGDPATRQLLYEVTGAAYDVEAFRGAVQTELGLWAFLTAGNDRLEGTDGIDHLAGGAGDDLYILNDTLDWAHEETGGGYDTVQVGASYALRHGVERLVLTGSGGHTGVGNELDNEIIGNDDGNRLAGALGDDTLDGGAGDDILFGGAGADILIGGEGDDTFHIEDSLDQVVEQWGDGFDRVLTHVDFTLAAGLEIEQISARGPNGLRLTGNELNNNIVSGVGNDVLDGGDGFDMAVYHLATGAVSVNLTTGQATGHGTDSLTGFEAVAGSAYGDQIVGNQGNNELRGYLGDDVLYGFAGDDRLIGGDGDDILEGGAGDDELRGGEGLDTARFLNSDVPVLVDLQFGLAVGFGVDILHSIERVVGSNHDDWLIGGLGNDQLLGGAGHDLIGGGPGDDRLTGGTGDDLFYYEGPSGVDVIMDFTAGAGSEDQIALDPAWFDDFADVLASTRDTGGGAVITTPGGTIRLVGVTRAQLHEDDFLFCGCASAAVGAMRDGFTIDEGSKDRLSEPLVLPSDADASLRAPWPEAIETPGLLRLAISEATDDWAFLA